MVAAVADSLGFEHKYRSVVIAWAPEDRPTDAAGHSAICLMTSGSELCIERPMLASMRSY